jgi:hypothetical protein
VSRKSSGKSSGPPAGKKASPRPRKREGTPIPPEEVKTLRSRLAALKLVPGLEEEADAIEAELSRPDPMYTDGMFIQCRYLLVEVNDGDTSYHTTHALSDMGPAIVEREKSRADFEDDYDTDWSLRLFDLDAGEEITWTLETLAKWGKRKSLSAP